MLVFNLFYLLYFCNLEKEKDVMINIDVLFIIRVKI